MTLPAINVPIAHVDDAQSVADLLAVLRALHGSDYDFAVGVWEDGEPLTSPAHQVLHRFVVMTEQAAIDLRPGERVRGVPAQGPYEPLDATMVRVTANYREALWPGDVICVTDGDGTEPTLRGRGTYFDVITERTDYPTPRLVLLRHLPDKPGGCAAYKNAFRREALPPAPSPAGSSDQRGANRVNEHTLDMRMDRKPQPGPHHHGPVPTGATTVVNHSETAIVLPRALYHLSEPEAPDAGRVVVYQQEHDGAAAARVIPVRPGSIVVTPATPGEVVGHCFENAFAMLIAIPGFVAPHHPPEKES